MSLEYSKDHASNLQSSMGYHRVLGVTEARARAQEIKRATQKRTRTSQERMATKLSQEKKAYGGEQTSHSGTTLLTDAISAYLQDHEGGNHSVKTLEWHATALGLLRRYLEEHQVKMSVEEVAASDISAWLAYLRKVPGQRGKPRSERTIQTYARSARAFFYWLMRREIIERNPFDQVVFPKVGRPLIQTIEPEEFERLLQACTPSHESGPRVERAVARNRAILWLFYDTGIRVSELCNLRQGDFDWKHGILTVKGKGSKERRIALGNTCLRNLLHYLDNHRPDEEELAEWGSIGEDHLFLSEARRALTKNGVEMLFKRLKERAGMKGKRVSPHLLRHTFAINYLVKSNDPFSLQEWLFTSSLSSANRAS